MSLWGDGRGFGIGFYFGLGIGLSWFWRRHIVLALLKVSYY